MASVELSTVEALSVAAAPAAVAVSPELAVSEPLAALCPGTEEPQLDANRLHVYHVALELHCLCSTGAGRATALLPG